MVCLCVLCSPVPRAEVHCQHSAQHGLVAGGVVPFHDLGSRKWRQLCAEMTGDALTPNLKRTVPSLGIFVQGLGRPVDGASKHAPLSWHFQTKRAGRLGRLIGPISQPSGAAVSPSCHRKSLDFRLSSCAAFRAAHPLWRCSPRIFEVHVALWKCLVFGSWLEVLTYNKPFPHFGNLLPPKSRTSAVLRDQVIVAVDAYILALSLSLATTPAS
jgi:hypothetical protein